MAAASVAMAMLTAGNAASPVQPRPAAPSSSPGVTASPPPALSVAERYARADSYQWPKFSKLVLDGNMRATFTRDGAGVMYRTGHAGARTLMYLELASGQSRALTDEPALARLLAQATGKEVDPAHLDLDGIDYDAANGVLAFDSADTRWTLGRDGALARAERGPVDGEGAISPDGRFRVIYRDYNLFAQDVRTRREVALTTDGTREQPYGRSIPMLADILKQNTEEPVLPVSVRWSPDSRSIITWRLDTRDVPRLSITQESPPDSFYPRSFRYVYPLAGARHLPQATRFAVNVEQALKRRRAKLVPLAIPSESILYPVDPDMSWSNGRVRAQWTERGYRQLLVYEADPVTGAARITAREAVKPIVTVTSTLLIPAPEMGGELDVSERSGWAQLYLVTPDNPDGGYPLTRGEWEVTGIEHVDPVGRNILLTGVGRERDRNPYYTALYRVRLDGSQPVLLTPEPLEHEVTVSPDGRWFVDAMSSATSPTVTVVRSTDDGRIVATLGRADPGALFATGFTAPEPFRGVAADGHTPLYGMIFRPANFDPNRKYPVIDEVYTGPTTTDVPTSWAASVGANGNSLAQIGAVVVMIDGRGTSRRGQKFRLPAFQNLGEVGLDDHIAMIRQMAAKYPYLDTSRVGVFGGSAGGYDAARFVFRRPNFFKVAVASSGNHDLRLDKAWWPEVSMGDADIATWDRNSNLSVARNLTGKLLLIHGDIDDNVPVTETMRLANTLITAGRDVDIVILPNTTHRVSQPFFWRKLRDYFTRNLLDETPPAMPLPPPAPVAHPGGTIAP